MTVHFKALTPDGLERGVATQFQYPGGELHLKNIKDVKAAAWIADVRFASLDDLGYAAMLANIAHKRQTPFILLLPYIPAARSDHVAEPDPTGVAVYGQFVKAMNPQQVIAIDPHSNVSDRYYPNLTALSPTPLILRALQESGHHYDAVIAPDEGAVGRAAEVADTLGIDCLHAVKHREYNTGKILNVKMESEVPDKSGNYLVVDDICDGGGTFMGLADAIGLPKEQLGLWVTHGIFSGNAPQLRERYSHIYTTDSHPGHGRIGCATTIIPTETYMFQNFKEFSA